MKAVTIATIRQKAVTIATIATGKASDKSNNKTKAATIATNEQRW